MKRQVTPPTPEQIAGIEGIARMFVEHQSAKLTATIEALQADLQSASATEAQARNARKQQWAERERARQQRNALIDAQIEQYRVAYEQAKQQALVRARAETQRKERFVIGQAKGGESLASIAYSACWSRARVRRILLRAVKAGELPASVADL